MASAFTSMMTKSEEARITGLAAAMPDASVAVEVGCWVGESSKAILRGFGGAVHLIDRFQWTQLHAQKVPDLLPVGSDFSAITKQNLASFGAERVTFHHGRVEDFQISALGDPLVGLLLLDGPKDPQSVEDMILRFLPKMAEDGRILIKHAASTSLAKMMDLIIRLMEAGVLIRAEDCPPDVGDTMLAFYPGQAAAVSSELLISSWLDIFDAHLSQTLTHCPAAQLVPLIWLLRCGHVDAAVQRARGLPYSPTMLSRWVALQDVLVVQDGADVSVLVEIEMNLAA